jgi:hypothetical protein
VRNGCFCAHPLILHLLKVDKETAEQVRMEMMNHNRTNLPGLIRMSFGLYNTIVDVDLFIEALKAVSAGNYQGDYVQDAASGEFHPKGWQPQFASYYTLD